MEASYRLIPLDDPSGTRGWQHTHDDEMRNEDDRVEESDGSQELGPLLQADTLMFLTTLGYPGMVSCLPYFAP